MPPAAVVKLVYTHGSGPCGLAPVEVRILSAALELGIKVTPIATFMPSRTG
jgi:hypothetical protein